MTRGKAWSMEDKLNAAMAYALTGFSDQASKICNIPERTIRDWTKQDWFKQLLEEARLRKQEELDGQWTGMIHLATAKMLERIEQGDPVVNPKTKEVSYVPVKLRDLAISTAVMTDKRALLRGQATSRVEKVDANKRLNDLAKVLDKPTLIDEAINED